MFISRAATGTLLSRVSGLVRDVLFAYIFGASGQYDAYIVAISIPFLLRAIFAEGGLSSAFIPIYNRSAKKNAFATSVLFFLLGTAGFTSVILMVFSPTFIHIFATGLRSKSFAYAVVMERITAFFLLFISLWSWGASILNSHKSFFVPSLSPLFNNLFIIGGLLISFLFHKNIIVVAVGFLIGGAFQFIFEIPFLKKIGFHLEISENNQERKKFLRSFAFTSLAVSLGQINLFVDTNVASRLASGSISVLQYANRIYQLPIGILAVSLATVYLPEMSSQSSVKALKTSIHDALSKLFFIMIPSTIFMALFSQQIIDVVYAHGFFSFRSALLTSQVLLILVIGLPFRSLVIVMNRALYAFENAKLATFVTLGGITVNVVGDVTLGFKYSVNGLATATTLSAIVTSLLLYLIERRKYKIRLLEIKKEFLKILASALLSSVPALSFLTVKNSFLSLSAGFFAFIITFILLLFLFKSENASNILRILNKKRKKE